MRKTTSESSLWPGVWMRCTELAVVDVAEPVPEGHVRQRHALRRRQAARFVAALQLRLDEARAAALRDDVDAAEGGVAEHVVPVVMRVHDHDAAVAGLAGEELGHGSGLGGAREGVDDHGQARREDDDRQRSGTPPRR